MPAEGALDGYLSGAVSLAALAEALHETPADTVVRLEQLGLSRTPVAIVLSDAQRAAIDARLRGDRSARRGEPATSSAAIEREVIASQRIAGIDARPPGR